MPRRARIAISGIPRHIIQRGNNRSACFYADEDYQRYLDTMQELTDRYGCSIHAYVLMTNHVHLLLTPKRTDSASLFMKHLGQRYVQYVNRTYRRSGTLWEGRFRSCLTQKEDYVLTCYRYIELNPVRADMVSHPQDYRWSSYRVNGEGKPSSLLRPHSEYLHLGRDEGERGRPTAPYSRPTWIWPRPARSGGRPTVNMHWETGVSRLKSSACSDGELRLARAADRPENEVLLWQSMNNRGLSPNTLHKSERPVEVEAGER